MKTNKEMVDLLVQLYHNVSKYLDDDAQHTYMCPAMERGYPLDDYDRALCDCGWSERDMLLFKIRLVSKRLEDHYKSVSNEAIKKSLMDIGYSEEDAEKAVKNRM